MRRSGVLLKELALFYSGPISSVLLRGNVLEMLLGFYFDCCWMVKRLFAFEFSTLKFGDPCRLLCVPVTLFALFLL